MADRPGERRRAEAGGPGGAPVPAALRLPAQGLTETGVVDLGGDGLAVVAVASTVNFALRTPAEQDGLVATFGAYLHSLAAPVQLLVRTHRLDLTGPITELREQAAGLPHPALEAAALEHAEHLADLAAGSDLLRRQVLLILREPLSPVPAGWSRGQPGGARRGDPESGGGARRAVEARVLRRLGEAAELLAPAGITVRLLDARQATAVLAAACDPATRIPSTGMAGAEQIITTPAPRPPSRPAPDPDRRSDDSDWTDDGDDAWGDEGHRAAEGDDPWAGEDDGQWVGSGVGSGPVCGGAVR